MKRLYMITILCFASLGTEASLSFGQEASHKASPKTPCVAGTINFTCPKGFTSLPTEAGSNLALLFRKDYSLGLFVVVPEPGYDEQKIVGGAIKTALARFFPKEPEAYFWKPMPVSGSISKYEVSGAMAKGFNGALSVIVRYRQLKVRGKEIFVGYVAEIGKGKEAKEFYERGEYGDSMSGCNAAVELIYSITGEKIKDGEMPCMLITDSPGQP
jgi:hypothetical protein